MAGAGLSRSLNYEPALDGLRGIAVVAVLIFHAYPGTLIGGWAGVDIFFVLSGYLITRILRNELAETNRINFVRFYIRRAIRLMPAFWTLLAVLLVVIAFSKYRVGLEKSWLMAASYLMNWNRAFGWWPEHRLAHTWSLAAEEQFYLIWPVLFLCLRNRRPLVWLVIAIAATIAWRAYLVTHGAPSARVYNGLDTRSDALLIGCCLALVPTPPVLLRFINDTWLVWVAAMGSLLVWLRWDAASTLTLGISLVAALAAVLIVASRHGILNAALSFKPIVFTGRISYGLYLWHFPLLEMINSKIPRAYPLVLTYLIATASYFTVERFFRRLKGRLDGRSGVAEPDTETGNAARASA
jgi:peptidoglycan/LPS O-acetylase OafA/YrhL